MCSQNGIWQSIYVGYGIKNGDTCQQPTSPPDVMKDPEDSEEQPEPTPLVAPEPPLEPDTDEENKKGEEDE